MAERVVGTGSFGVVFQVFILFLQSFYNVVVLYFIVLFRLVTYLLVYDVLYLL